MRLPVVDARSGRRVDPVGWLVRGLAGSRMALPLFGTRLLASAALGAYYIDHLQHSYPLLAAAPGRQAFLRAELPATALLALWLLALACCAVLFAGYACRACAAVIWLAAIASTESLKDVAYLDDYVATWLATWLLLLPLRRTPRLLGVLRSPREREALRRGELPGGTIVLVLLSSSVLYAQTALWDANAPGYEASPVVHGMLALAALTALWGPGASVLSSLALLGGHLWLVREGAPPVACIALLALAPLYGDAWLRRLAGRRDGAKGGSEPAALGLSTALAFSYVAIAALHGCATAADARTRIATRNLLDSAFLLPPRERAVAWRAAAVALVDEHGEPVRNRLTGALDARATLLRSYVTPAPWGDDARLREDIGDRLRQALADDVCSQQPRAGSRFELLERGVSPRVEESEPRVRLRFECGPRSEPARLLPLSDYAGGLRLASHSGFEAPSNIPAAIEVESHVGSTRCAACHAAQHTSWLASRHARTLAVAGADNVRGGFKAKPPPGGAAVQMLRDGDRRRMVITHAGRAQSYRVDRVLGAGDSWQAYLSERAGVLHLLPWLWLERERRWSPLAELYPELYHASVPGALQVLRIEDAGCVRCHATAAHLRADHGGAVAGDGEGAALGWSEPAVGCEACHGPGRQHAALHRSAGSGADPYASAANAGVVERRCAGCHGPSGARGQWYFAGSVAGASLEHDAIGADGRPLRPGYQQPAFAMSPCHRRGGAGCADCHAAHPQPGSALDARSPRICTGCHRELSDPGAQRAHTQHPQGLVCHDCHMPRAPLRGDWELGIRFTDHGISVPRPVEAELLGVDSACTTCHRERDNAWASGAMRQWNGQVRDRVRPWVRELHAIKEGAFASAHRPDVATVVGALASDNRPLRLGLLRLLGRVRPEPGLRGALLSLAADPDVELRAAALTALSVHDPDGRDGWLERGAGDRDPQVRVASLRRLLDLQRMSEHAQRRYLRDLLDYAAESPGAELVRLARLRSRAGERSEALALLDLAARYTLPDSRARFAAERRRLRERFASPGADGAGKP